MENFKLQRYLGDCELNGFVVALYMNKETREFLVRVETQNNKTAEGYRVITFIDHDNYIDWADSVTSACDWIFNTWRVVHDLLEELKIKDEKPV